MIVRDRVPVGKHAARRPVVVARATKARHERVLRYPNGEERRIIYPVDVSLEEEQDNSMAWDVVGLSSSRSPAARRAGSSTAQAALDLATVRAEAPVQPQQPDIASTTAYLESLFAAAYKDTLPEVAIEETYKVLSGCPWVLPRPVYVLAQQTGPDAETGSSYSLRVRMEQRETASELAMVLGRAALQDALSCSRMVDGLVMFVDEEAAQRYAAALAEEGADKVVVAQTDSHRAFKAASDARAVVVLVRGPPGGLPRPFQLAAALKRQRAWDDM